MKLLYISSWHGTLEYDELSLFTEMGIEWFSTGLYLNPQKPSLDHAPRKPINTIYNEELADEFLATNKNYKIYSVPKITKEFADKFDAILISHCSPTQLLPLQWNWDNIRHKFVAWRTYAQQTSGIEYATQKFKLDGLKLIRISPKERTIPHYAGDDAIIRGFIDDTEYTNWNGSEKIVLTFNNFFNRRTTHSNTNIYMNIRNRMSVPFELYGCDNKDCVVSNGELAWSDVKKKYRNARVYFALGSKPAALTYNFVEALMTGCPIVTWGNELGNTKQVADWQNTYEVPDIIQNGVNGFFSDNEYEIEGYIKELMHDEKLARSISLEARKTALAIFSKQKIKEDWSKFFLSLEHCIGA